MSSCRFKCTSNNRTTSMIQLIRIKAEFSVPRTSRLSPDTTSPIRISTWTMKLIQTTLTYTRMSWTWTDTWWYKKSFSRTFIPSHVSMFGQSTEPPPTFLSSLFPKTIVMTLTSTFSPITFLLPYIRFKLCIRRTIRVFV